MSSSRLWWFVSSAFSMMSAFIIYIIAVMLSNMDVIKLPEQGATNIEMHDSLAAFSSIYCVLIALCILALFVFFALRAGFCAARS